MEISVVAIGGGTGLPNVLKALKDEVKNLTAIVNVVDDGGSSGKLRECFNMIPPGDIRNCLVALAQNDDLAKLFDYRFGSELGCHSLGNLMLVALLKEDGDFLSALRKAKEILSVKGEVLPVSLEKVVLKAELKSGQIVTGQAKIANTFGIKKVFLEPKEPKVYSYAVEVLSGADLILIGPGSLYTSIIPNLLFTPLVEAINQSNALKVYVGNTMIQRKETLGFFASSHLKAIYDHSPNVRFDIALFNDFTSTQHLLKSYLEQEIFPVEVDLIELEGLAGKVVVSEVADRSDLRRHDPLKLREFFKSLLEEKCLFQPEPRKI